MAALGDQRPSTDEDDTPSSGAATEVHASDAATEVREAAAAIDQPTTEWPAAHPVPPLSPEAEAAVEASESAEVAAAVSVQAAVEADEVAEAAVELDRSESADEPALKKRLATEAASAAASAGEAAKQAGAAAQEAGAAAKEVVKEKTVKARGRLGKAAADAREGAAHAAAGATKLAADAASGARERAANTDMKELAASTTSLIDTARPFFLAGCAAVFALLGFIEGEHGTSQIFAVGAIICVLGAAFSGEINAMLHARAERTASAARKADAEKN